MSQQNTNSDNYRDDEIDLRKLFQSIGKGFSNMGRGVIKLILTIRRASLGYKYLLGVMVLLGAIIGGASNKTSKAYFNTSMLLSSDYFNAKLVENSINKLNALCGEEERSGLASILNIDVSIAKNIKSFDFEPLVLEQDIVDVEVLKQKLEELKVKDTDISKVIDQIQIQNKKSFVISVQIYNNTIIENLQESLVSYFRQNPYVKNRIEINKENKLKLIEKLKIDIAQLDSLKELFNLNLKANADRTGEKASSNVYVGESGALNPSTIYYQGISLYGQLQSLQRDVELGSDFELIDGFTIFSKPESLNIKTEATYFALAFLGIAYFLIILIETNKYLNRIEKDGFKD